VAVKDSLPPLRGGFHLFSSHKTAQRFCIARRTNPKAGPIKIPRLGFTAALRTGLRRASLDLTPFETPAKRRLSPTLGTVRSSQMNRTQKQSVMNRGVSKVDSYPFGSLEALGAWLTRLYRLACWMAAWGMGAGLLGGAAGCARVGVHQQRLVSKPNMVFSDSVVFGYSNRLMPQIEPGSAFSGGAQAGGCTSCR
jgi:hypothetical protein